MPATIDAPPPPAPPAPKKPRAPAPTPRVFSGMQPSGILHVGNYMGALRTWVDLVEEGTRTGLDCVFCIVDQHALTSEYEPREMHARVLDAARIYIAAGVDPRRCKLFVQSHVPEHTELAWYLTTLMPMGELQRMTQFKEKSEQHKIEARTGIFVYPLLMAADILLYKTTLVPVGEDQVQHLEFTREAARKFNTRFAPKSRPTFPEPMPRLSNTPRIMGLDGQHKMSKSRGNDIGMLDDDATILKKLKGAFTDPQRLRREDPGRPEVCNIFTMHKAVSPPATVEHVDLSCRTAAWGCGDCKQVLGQSLSRHLTPIRIRARELADRPTEVLDALADGARQCRVIARETMREVRDCLGLLPATATTALPDAVRTFGELLNAETPKVRALVSLTSEVANRHPRRREE